MSTQAFPSGAPSYARPRPLALERIGLLLLWIVGASSSLVFIEPSPYEVAMAAALGFFVLTGLTVRAVLMPLLILLVMLNAGYSIAASSLYDDGIIRNWVLTSWYLAVTSLFLAAVLCDNTEQRLKVLMAGCLAAGLITALAGVAGYFRVVPGGADLLLLYDRARGTFKDPNVFGAFLVLPAMIALQRVIAGRFWEAARNLAFLGLFAVAILLSFSRAAWGQLAFAAMLVMFFTFVTSPSANQRMRIVLLTIFGLAAIVLLLVALMSVGSVAELLEQRLSLNQSYDVGEQGRFGRHALGAILALDQPFGLGPLQFAKVFPEDPHNTFLNAFVSGGWMSGLAFPTLTALTLAFGLRPMFTATPWQSTAIVIYSSYLGLIVESLIIDTDHWRHAFFLLGVQWGLIAATRHARTRTALARV